MEIFVEGILRYAGFSAILEITASQVLVQVDVIKIGESSKNTDSLSALHMSSHNGGSRSWWVPIALLTCPPEGNTPKLEPNLKI